MEKNEHDCALAKRVIQIMDLPVEIMQHIFNFEFALTDLKRASLVCKTWYSITRYTLNRSWLRIDGSMLRENMAQVFAERRGCRAIRIKLDNTLLDAWQSFPDLDMFGKSVTSLQLTAPTGQFHRLSEILQCFANLRELAIFTTMGTYHGYVHYNTSVRLPILPKLTILCLTDHIISFCDLLVKTPNLKSLIISPDPLFNVADVQRASEKNGFEFLNPSSLPCGMQLDSLSSMRLDFNEHNGIVPESSCVEELFGHFPCLRNVYIRSQQEEKIKLILLALANQCHEISELQISWNKHGSCGWLDLLANIKKLKVLHLAGCFKCLRCNRFGQLTPFRDLVGVVSRLSDLHLAYCCIDDKRLAILCSQAKLNHLRLQHCHFISDAWVLNLAMICPTLQRLTVSQCAMIRTESIEELKKIMPNMDITYHEMQ